MQEILLSVDAGILDATALANFALINYTLAFFRITLTDGSFCHFLSSGSQDSNLRSLSMVIGFIRNPVKPNCSQVLCASASAVTT